MNKEFIIRQLTEAVLALAPKNYKKVGKRPIKNKQNVDKYLDFLLNISMRERQGMTFEKWLEGENK